MQIADFLLATQQQRWEFIKKKGKKESTLSTKKKRKNDNGQENKERKHALEEGNGKRK